MCLITICLLCSCATPVTQYNNLAQEYSLVKAELLTNSFRHVYFYNQAANEPITQKTLHVYLEGDGTPWINGRWIATDPTPRNAVMLALMKLDNSPAVLLGRPCYHLQVTDPNCQPSDWTQGRYSKKVVESLVQALEQLRNEFGFTQVALFGHSGGGVLALLMADAMRHQSIQVTAIITLAANLDIDAWTEHHGYLPLDQSLNPASRPALASSVHTRHLFGADDSIVNADVFSNYLAANKSASTMVYPNFDHHCCWQTIWPTELNSLPANTNNTPLDADF